MPQKRHTFPEVKLTLVTFDLIPGNDEGLVGMARHDLSRLKHLVKEKRAFSECNACRVRRSEKAIVIDFLDTTRSEESATRFRMVYELIRPFS